ncbi:glycosyltransferase family 39 protein [Flavobacterium acetivorans]|uniref:glycosyltransferase family 39 protein n=1 Tax=Flavobacterium acetivorans TaxID=2893883 RepID=UPI001E43280D|nr:glycosyltransferase family 39 protein [Flavobacterium sp. F-29]UFH35767.1 glycosyltransferase family 39 protein [Flavobacterium sp. F-29]
MGNNFYIFKKDVYKYSVFSVIVLFVLAFVFNKGFEDFSFSFFLPIFFIGFALSFYQSQSKLGEKTYIFKLIIVTFCIKLVAIVVFTEILKFYNSIPFLSYKDDYNYYHSAVSIARVWETKGISIVEDIQFSTGFYSGYPNICALGIYYFGESEHVLRIMNAVASSFIVYYAYKTMRLLFNEKSSKITISIIAFSPLIIYFSSFILKDILLLLFTIVTIYGFIKILKGTVTVWTISLILVNLTAMIFFRAATIIPLFLAFIVTYLVSFFKGKKNFSYLSIVIIGFLAFAFFKIWDYISGLNIINDSAFYYETRFNGLMNKDVTSSGSNLGKLSFLAVVGLPFFLIASVFLPTFMFLNLGDAETINYSASALLYHLAVLPFIILAFFYCLKNIKKIEPGLLLIILILVFFKIGLATSINSLFSARQSLGATYVMYLILPICFQYEIRLKKSLRYFVIAFVVMLLFNLLRLIIRL